jgi:hypothetical protein
MSSVIDMKVWLNDKAVALTNRINYMVGRSMDLYEQGNIQFAEQLDKEIDKLYEEVEKIDNKLLKLYWNEANERS